MLFIIKKPFLLSPNVTSKQLLTHHQQMSSLAFGHLQLGSPDEVDDPFLASCRGKPDAACHTGRDK